MTIPNLTKQYQESTAMFLLVAFYCTIVHPQLNKYKSEQNAHILEINKHSVQE